MFKLISKDFYLQKWMMLLYLALIFLYLWADIQVTFSIFIIGANFVINAHYYDEKDNANLLLNSLPYTRKQIVTSKYIGALVSTTFAAIITFILALIAQWFFDKPFDTISFKNIFLSYLFVMLFTSLYLPFFYKFSKQYLLVIFSLIFVLIMIFAKKLFVFFAPYLDRIFNFLTSVSNFNFYIISTFFSICIFTLSLILSIRIYSNKEF